MYEVVEYDSFGRLIPMVVVSISTSIESNLHNSEMKVVCPA